MIGCGGTMMMEKYAAADTMWVLIGAFMVFFMQPGFAMVETGFTRAKNAGNIVMKNFMDLCLGSIVFWIIGFGLMFGTDIDGLIGAPDFFVQNDYGASYPSWAFFIFQTVFCATAATIVSGAMAERTKFSVYCIYSILISAVIYPVSGHWIWGGGWLGAMGFHDFAGSTAVHMVGGVAALVGAKILGPRIGKYNADGSVNAIPGHSLTLGALGVFILWFGWFGFNGGSEFKADAVAALAILNTVTASAAGMVSWLVVERVRTGRPTLVGASTGLVAGLVVVTPGAGFVEPWAALVMGLIVSPVCYLAISHLKTKFGYDDALDAFGCHGIGGILGGVLTGLFCVPELSWTGKGGLFYTGDVSLLISQILGIVVTVAIVLVLDLVIAAVVKALFHGSLRVDEADEALGLDASQHGESAYPSFSGLD